MMAAVKWRWVLARSVDMSWIHELSHANDRSLSPALNKPGSATFGIDLKAPEAYDIEPLSTALICYRNARAVWSGPIWTISETLSSSTHRATVTAMGWLELLMHRILKCGLQAPASMPTTTAITQVYSAEDQGAIAADLLARTNAEMATGITLGTVDVSTNRNRTYNQYQNIGQEIVTMANLDSGYDIDIDPLTKQLSFYFRLVKEGTTIYGLGRDNPKVVFQYGSNLTDFSRTIDGSKTVNQFTAIGKYGRAQVDDVESQARYGLFEETGSMSEVVDPNILAAFAAAEVSVRAIPQRINTFTPKPFHEDKNVPQPFDDYNLGDICGLTASYGRIQEGVGDSPQPTRLFGFTIGIDNNGVEKLSNVATVNSA